MLLRTFLDTQQFAPEYTHVNQLVLSKALTSIVQIFFKTNHPDIFRRIKEFCQMKVKNHKKPRVQDKSYFKEYNHAERRNPEKRAEQNARQVVLRQARQQLIADEAVVGVRNPDQPLALPAGSHSASRGERRPVQRHHRSGRDDSVHLAR